ncbi:MAG: hypothetical protein ACJAYG_000914 [Oceanicoccus sp.]|jgi:uncharacterized protein (DUF1499 family)
MQFYLLKYICLSLFLLQLASNTYAEVTSKSSVLAPCPITPNCVSTQAEKPSQHIKAPRLLLSTEQTWPKIIAIINAAHRTTIIEKNQQRLKVEYRSQVFGFVDDLEIYIEPLSKQLEMRSASRSGYSDMGVNRRRAEQLIYQLIRQGVVK